LLALLSGLGVTNTIGRYVPELLHRGALAELRRLIGNLLSLRLLCGGAAAILYFAATVFWLHDVGAPVLAIMAASVFVHALSGYLFTLFLGYDEAARWGMFEMLRRWLSLVLVVPGFALGGLVGAGLSVLSTDIVLLGLGLRWGRLHVTPADLRLDLPALMPYVRFGLLFFANHALAIAFQGSGEPLVRIVSRDYTQVGYFALANNTYQAAAGAFPQLTLAFVPLLTRLVHDGATREVGAWVERLLRWLTIASVAALFGALLLGDTVVPLIFGADYAAVAPNLSPLMLALLMVGVGNVTVLVAMVHDRPGVALAASALRLAVFWMAGPVCVAWGGSLGACLAVVAASIVHAAFSVWRLRRWLRGSLRSAAIAAGLSLLFLPLLLLKGAAAAGDIALYALFAAGYASVLFGARVITTREVALVWRTVRGRVPAAEAPPARRGPIV
jgi:O-antigen/teichoic acid export membrane protein